MSLFLIYVVQLQFAGFQKIPPNYSVLFCWYIALPEHEVFSQLLPDHITGNRKRWTSVKLMMWYVKLTKYVNKIITYLFLVTGVLSLIRSKHTFWGVKNSKIDWHFSLHFLLQTGGINWRSFLKPALLFTCLIGDILLSVDCSLPYYARLWCCW
jgi:hypothetical protein